MRAVLDTNVLISGLFWHGAPHALLNRVRDGRLGWISSPALLTELADVLGRPKLAAILTKSQTSREQLLAELGQLPDLVDAPPLPRPVCRDPGDDQVLALAIVAQVDLIVSGDDDLLSLVSFSGIPIVDAAAALQALDQS